MGFKGMDYGKMLSKAETVIAENKGKEVIMSLDVHGIPDAEVMDILYNVPRVMTASGYSCLMQSKSKNELVFVLRDKRKE